MRKNGKRGSLISPDFFEGSKPAPEFDEVTRKIAERESKRTLSGCDNIDDGINWELMDGGGERPRSWMEDEI